MVLSIQCVDGDVNQMEDHFTAIHVSVRVLLCKENTSCFFFRIKCKQKKAFANDFIKRKHDLNVNSDTDE